MRSLCASSNGIVFIAMCLMLSCASVPPRRDSSGLDFIDGVVNVTGDHILDRRILLTEPDGTGWLLTGSDFESDLIGLDGLAARVWGTMEKGDEPGGTLRVERYELLPVGGITPVIGVLHVDGDDLILVAGRTGERIELGGALAGVLFHFDGVRVWVWGKMESESNGESVLKVLEVRGYGILGPSLLQPAVAPSGTLRDSSSR